jgi:hypothetical protein
MARDEDSGLISFGQRCRSDAQAALLALGLKPPVPYSFRLPFDSSKSRSLPCRGAFLIQAGLCHGIVCCSGFDCILVCQLPKMF